MQIRLNSENEKRIKLRVKEHGGTPTLVTNMLLSVAFYAEEKEVEKRVSAIRAIRRYPHGMGNTERKLKP